MSEAGGAPAAEAQIEQAAYDILRQRLSEQARGLKQKVEALNQRRVGVFGGMEMAVVGNEKIRTEQNCIPRDIVSVGEHLLVGYEVQYGRKAETPLSDVLALYTFQKTEEGYLFEPVPPDAEGNLLAHPNVERDFRELFKYYKNARLLHLRQVTGKILAVFQIGSQVNDVRVMRWTVDPQGRANYVDYRGEPDNVFPPTHDFEWTPTTRENHVTGRHPHVNILDEVFVEAVGGDLTVKVENNTEDGLGVYREPVVDPNQALQDAQILYARIGVLILIKILPYRETGWRYLVFNTRTKEVHRVDAVGQSCVQLPEDHGIVFPGGFYLKEGSLKKFEGDFEGMFLERAVKSPNGEDVLYIWHHLDKGHTALMAYNLIRKEVATPIHCHGYCLFPDGSLVVFKLNADEPVRVHPMQIWRTPFVREDRLDTGQRTGSFLEKVGNADLVRGISDCLSIVRRVEEQKPGYASYEDLIASVAKVEDVYHWLGHEEVGNIRASLAEVGKTGKLVLEEFDKVETLKRQASRALREVSQAMADLVRSLRPDDWTSISEYVEALGSLRKQRGHLITLKEMRYADLPELGKLEQQAISHYDAVSQRAVEFLLGEAAFRPYEQRIGELEAGIDQVGKVTEFNPLNEELEKIGAGLELLTEVLATIKIEDATVRTRILERIAEVMGQVNRVRALAQARRKELGEKESVAEFGVQFQLFGQSVTSAINLADSPEKCDAALSRLLLQLEELEGKFGEYEQFLGELTTKREDVYKTLSTKKQQLLDQRQRRAQQVISAAERILEGIVRKAGTLENQDELNSYFASDPMVMKVRDLEERLRELGDPVKADELASRLKTARQESTRTLRDKTEIYEEGANVIRFGRHRFSVNTEPVELTMVPREGSMYLNITGTDFFERLEDADFEKTRPYWDQELVSETPTVYRGEYLAYGLLREAEAGRGKHSLTKLYDVLRSGPPRQGGEDVHPGLLELVREVAADRYDEGYERGIHDHDATLILENLLYLYSSAGLLRFNPASRAAAVYLWVYGVQGEHQEHWIQQARSLTLMQKLFGANSAQDRLVAELSERIGELCSRHRLTIAPEEARQAGLYLFHELGKPALKFVASGDAAALKDAFVKHLESQRLHLALQEQLDALAGDPARRYELAFSWIEAFANRLRESGKDPTNRGEFVKEEAAVLMLTPRLERETVTAAVTLTVRGLLGQHPRVQSRQMELRLDEFLTRLEGFETERVPGFRDYSRRRLEVLARERHRLRMDEYTPKVMSAFVR
ncbi:MAG: DNA repair ATPase, partial [Candidatus Eremiobacterota bacterium]